MGQYYKYLVIDKDNTPHIGVSYDYDNGAKLMEHSYVGNAFVNSALDLIYFNPCRVAWVGDYSEDGSCVYNDKAENFNQYYNMAWGKYDSDTDQYIIEALKPDEPMAEEDMIKFAVEDCHYYLINHDKHCYVDIEKYVKDNKWHEEGDYTDYKSGENIHYSYDMCVNPLPILTACGNGQGGGDFRGSRFAPVDESAVGSWALDLLELADDKPFGYEEVEYLFIEERG